MHPLALIRTALDEIFLTTMVQIQTKDYKVVIHSSTLTKYWNTRNDNDIIRFYYYQQLSVLILLFRFEKKEENTQT